MDPRQRHLGGHHRIGGTGGVALNAGGLYQPGYRVAHQSQHIFQRHSGALGNGVVVAPCQIYQTTGGHGGCRADLCLAAPLGTADGGVLGDYTTNPGTDQQGTQQFSAGQTLLFLIGDEHGWNYPAAAGSGGGYNALHTGVALCHLHRCGDHSGQVVSKQGIAFLVIFRQPGAVLAAHFAGGHRCRVVLGDGVLHGLCHLVHLVQHGTLR